MADNWLVRALKRIGKAIIDVSLKALIVYIAVTMFGATGVIWIALRGNAHSPWFYGVAGVLASAVFGVLVLALLVAMRLRKADAQTLEDGTQRTFPVVTTDGLCPDKWLHEIAEEHAEAIQECLDIDCQVAGHKLISDDAYID